MKSETCSVIFAPIDLPLPPSYSDSQWRDILEETKVPTGRLSRDYFATRVLREIRGCDDSVLRQWEYDAEWEWSHIAEIDLDPLFQWLEEYMPYDKVTYAVVLRGNKDCIPPHKDILHDIPPEIYANEPCLYRICLQGDFNNKFFLCKDETGDEKLYPHLPHETRVFVANCTDVYHGVDDPAESFWLFISGKFSPEKHNNLLKRSLAKYSEHILFKKDLRSE